jgi:predicted GNAT family acetyltransferase
VEIKHYDEITKGAFYLEVDGNRLASMTYSKAGDQKIIIDHTFVDDSLKGQGIGYRLIEAVVDFARVNGLKIIPLCPFANAVFQKRNEYSDVMS